MVKGKASSINITAMLEKSERSRNKQIYQNMADYWVHSAVLAAKKKDSDILQNLRKYQVLQEDGIWYDANKREYSKMSDDNDELLNIGRKSKKRDRGDSKIFEGYLKTPISTQENDIDNQIMNIVSYDMAMNVPSSAYIYEYDMKSPRDYVSSKKGFEDISLCQEFHMSAPDCKSLEIYGSDTPIVQRSHHHNRTNSPTAIFDFPTHDDHSFQSSFDECFSSGKLHKYHKESDVLEEFGTKLTGSFDYMDIDFCDIDAASNFSTNSISGTSDETRSKKGQNSNVSNASFSTRTKGFPFLRPRQDIGISDDCLDLENDSKQKA